MSYSKQVQFGRNGIREAPFIESLNYQLH